MPGVSACWCRVIRYTDPADGVGYVIADGFPDEAARLFCCFDQPSLPCALAQAMLASRTLPEDLRNAVAEQTAIIREVTASRGCYPASLP